MSVNTFLVMRYFAMTTVSIPQSYPPTSKQQDKTITLSGRCINTLGHPAPCSHISNDTNSQNILKFNFRIRTHQRVLYPHMNHVHDLCIPPRRIHITHYSASSPYMSTVFLFHRNFLRDHFSRFPLRHYAFASSTDKPLQKHFLHSKYPPNCVHATPPSVKLILIEPHIIAFILIPLARLVTTTKAHSKFDTKRKAIQRRI